MCICITVIHTIISIHNNAQYNIYAYVCCMVKLNDKKATKCNFGKILWNKLSRFSWFSRVL